MLEETGIYLPENNRKEKPRFGLYLKMNVLYLSDHEIAHINHSTKNTAINHSMAGSWSDRNYSNTS